MSLSVDSKAHGSPLKTLRKSLGVSQKDLGAQVGYDRKTISRWETGQVTPKPQTLNSILRLLAQSARSSSANSSFRFVDLFAGIGGTRLGIEAVGGRCVFTSEWDKFAKVTYRTNFGMDNPIAGDVTKIPSDHIPPHELLVAGFPCQPFSIAGISKKNALGRPHGFADEAQGTLFFEIARILRDLSPKAFLLENVKNLQSHNRGRTFDVIRRILTEDLGYNLHFGVIDAAIFVPQHRERIFLVGFRDPVDFSWDDIAIPSSDDGPLLDTILHPEDGSEESEERFTDDQGRVHQKYILSDKLWSYLKAYAEKHRKKGNGFGYGLVQPSDIARTLSARYYKDGSEILVARDSGNPRRLTPRECSRLMGFDQTGGQPFEIPVSDTQAYKQFGNAVVVPIIRSIVSAMRPYLVEPIVGDVHQIDLGLE